MSVSERRNRRARHPAEFSLIPDRATPEDLAEVGRFGDMIGQWLGPLGGIVTDTGYDLVDRWAEMVIETPAGPVIEVRMRIAQEKGTILGDCQGCPAANTEVSLTYRNTRPVYLCRECNR